MIIHLTIYFDYTIYALKPDFISYPKALQEAEKIDFLLNRVKKIWHKNKYLFLQYPLLSQSGYLYKNKSIKSLASSLKGNPLFKQSFESLLSNKPLDEKIEIHQSFLILKKLLLDADFSTKNYTMHNIEKLVIKILAKKCFYQTFYL